MNDKNQHEQEQQQVRLKASYSDEQVTNYCNSLVRELHCKFPGYEFEIDIKRWVELA